jgi:hypothetical protein
VRCEMNSLRSTPVAVASTCLTGNSRPWTSTPKVFTASGTSGARRLATPGQSNGSACLRAATPSVIDGRDDSWNGLPVGLQIMARRHADHPPTDRPTEMPVLSGATVSVNTQESLQRAQPTR